MTTDNSELAPLVHVFSAAAIAEMAHRHGPGSEHDCTIGRALAQTLAEVERLRTRNAELYAIVHRDPSEQELDALLESGRPAEGA